MKYFFHEAIKKTKQKKRGFVVKTFLLILVFLISTQAWPKLEKLYNTVQKCLEPPLISLYIDFIIQTNSSDELVLCLHKI